MLSTSISFRKNLIITLFFSVLFSSSLAAGTDALGLAGFWDRVVELANDPYLSKFIFFCLVSIGIYRACIGAGFVQLVLMVIIGFLFLNVESIVNALAGGAML